ncbi:hypothetical protein EDD86DRAFT_220729 [Gorgonomyces haynaldii]|nr:hypothetical protein EDD86DRAFT_220729 [Gorgonomyces haynaldii]
MTVLPFELESFLSLQHQRPSIYKDLDCGFDLYIAKQGTEQEYQQLLQLVTKIFSELSASIKQQLEILDQMTDDVKESARISKEIQELEGQQWRTVVEYQQKMISTVFGQIDYTQECQELKKKRARIQGEIFDKMQELQAEMAEFEQ